MTWQVVSNVFVIFAVTFAAAIAITELSVGNHNPWEGPPPKKKRWWRR